MFGVEGLGFVLWRLGGVDLVLLGGLRGWDCEIWGLDSGPCPRQGSNLTPKP